LSFLHHVHACNRWDPADFVPFRVDGRRVGLTHRPFAEVLRRRPEVFHVSDDGVDWAHPAASFAERSAVMQETLEGLVAEGLVGHLHGEKYPVTAASRQEAMMLVDRACAPGFGVRAFGQHLNGYVRDDDGLKLWVARRAADRRIYPNHLDNLVAGGLPWGTSLVENMEKECREEAGMSPDLARRAVPVGAVTYCRASDRGLKPDVMYCYDLELPPDFEPRCTDGEVQAFYLWPVEQVLETVRDTDEFKLNCNLVIIDFLIRHGRISQDDPDYLELIRGLRGALP
jgi:isopentenyldiphosphate isomerase